MFQPLAYIPSILFRHSPRWFVTLAIALLSGAGFFAYYPVFRLLYGQWVADHLMFELPQDLSYWLLGWVLLFWVGGSLAWNEAKRQQVAARIVFDSPHTWWTGIGPDQEKVVADRFVQVVSIRVKNSPHNLEDGRDIKGAHAHAVFRMAGQQPKRIEYLRWTEANKPRRDETPLGITPKFRHEMQFMDIPANDSWRQIDFVVSGQDSKHFYAFPGRAQMKGWMDPECKLPNGEYSIDIEIRGKGLSSTAKTILHFWRLDDRSLFIQSALIREGINLGAAIEMENSHVAR